MSNEEINKHQDLEVNLNNDSIEIEILYGPSYLEYFRGYLFSQNQVIDKPLNILKKFDGLPVYRAKYGNEKTIFKSAQMILIAVDQFIFFYQIRKKWTTNEWDELKEEFEWMIQDFCTDKKLIQTALANVEPQY